MIDIIIPTYNRRKHLEATLTSILNQSVDAKLINVIIVDDGSSDGSNEVVEQYADRLNLKYFYQEDKGYRAGRARNVGLRNSSEDVFLLIDSGIVLESTCIEKHLRLHHKFCEPISVIGYVYGFDNEESDLNELEGIIGKLKNIDDVIRHLDKIKKFLDVRED